MKNFSSKIFIDGGNPQETEKAKELLGFLDGQTTNPTLIAKNLKNRISEDPSARLSQGEALEEYKKIVKKMSQIIPRESVSIQVFANQETKMEEMLYQARQRNAWIKNASIKLPCSKEGLKAASILCREMPINITLVFSQSQAAAVYEATLGAKYPVFISPFVGRLDDRGECGMDVVANILKMYKEGRSGGRRTSAHVEVLTASVRSLDHVLYALDLGSNIITIPFKVFRKWAEADFKKPGKNYKYDRKELEKISYQEKITLGKPWESYNLQHDLTDNGITRFWSDWVGLF